MIFYRTLMTQYEKYTRLAGEPGKGLYGISFILNERAVIISAV